MAIFDQIILVTVGGVIGILGGVATTWFGMRRQWTHERESLTRAFAGEVNAILIMIQYRRYKENIEECIERVQRTQKPEGFIISMSQSAFQVYLKNVDKIGLLRPVLAKQVVGFYTFLFSLIQDVAAGSAPIPKTAEEDLRHLAMVRELGMQVLDQGRLLLEELERPDSSTISNTQTIKGSAKTKVVLTPGKVA